MRKERDRIRVRRCRTLLCVCATFWMLIAGAWITSCFRAVDCITPRTRSHFDYGVFDIHVSVDDGTPDYVGESFWELRQSSSSILGEYGFQLPKYTTAGYADRVLARGLELPIWPLLLIMSWLVWRAWRRLRQAKQEVNSCIHCGYSMTFNTSGSCPECGTAIPTVATVNGKT